jgi:hypothetical protein
MMPESRLKIGFDPYYGDEGASEQILMIPFREEDDVKHFMVRGVSEGDGRVTRCDMVSDGLGSIDRISRGFMGGAMGRDAIQAEGRRDEHAINITTPHIFPIFGDLPKK